MNNLSKYYQILGLENNATQKEVKKAYRILAKQWHPDLYVNQSEEEQSIALAKFKEIVNAYEIIVSGKEEGNSNTYNYNPTGIKVKKTDPKVYFDLGNLALEDGDLSQAVEYFSAAIKINPEYREAYICRANALEKQGFQLRANSDWRKAKELKLEETTVDLDTGTKDNVFINNYKQKNTETKNKKTKIDKNFSSFKYHKNVSENEDIKQDKNEVFWQVKYSLIGHKSSVNAIVVNSYIGIIISGDGEGKINIWDLKTRKIKYSLNIHKKAIHTLALSNNGQILATAGEDKNIKIWNLTTRLLIGTIGGWLSGHKQDILSVTFSHDDQYIISSSADNTVRMWHINTKKEVFKYDTYSDKILTIKLTSNGEYLATAGMERWIKIINLQKGKLAKSLKTNNGVTAIAFSPDSKILASAGFDRQIKLWDWQNKQIVEKLFGHSETISALAFSFQDNYLISCSWDGSVKIWDWDRQKCVATLKTHSKEINCLAISQDGKYIIVGGADGVIKIVEKKQ